MDLILEVLGTAIVQRQTAISAKQVSADGYVPPARRQPKRSDGRVHKSDDNGSIGLVLSEATVRLAVLFGCAFVSLRFTQFLTKMKEKDIQNVVRAHLKKKLAARHDINMRNLHFSSHEISVVQDVVGSEDLDTTFDMIGGLGDLKEEIMDIVTLACSKEASRQGVRAPRGILLSGAPGTGKTMLARAIAKESGATFINVRMGAVQQKWVGEGEKVVAAIFSLANKLAPSIIFIDEIDCFMATRNSMEQDHILRVKTEFMTLWDGLLTERSRPVIVLGTTNRPTEIDPAILRRLPRQFVVGLPETVAQRENILRLISRKYRLGGGVNLQWVAEQTARFSGSDLDALFQAAQTVPAREFARALREHARDRAAAQAAPRQAAETVARNAAAPRDWQTVRERIAELSRSFAHTAERARRIAVTAAESQQRVHAIERALPQGAEVDVSDVEVSPALQMRPISHQDFEAALERVRPTGEVASPYAASIRALADIARQGFAEGHLERHEEQNGHTQEQ